jgi:hypothetical protein
MAPGILCGDEKGRHAKAVEKEPKKKAGVVGLKVLYCSFFKNDYQGENNCSHP